MMRRMYVALMIMSALAVSGNAFAADSTTTAPITWSGLVDVYYSKNFNSPSTQTNQLRNFDIYENQFGFSLAKLTVQKEAQPVGFRLDLAFGPTNDIVQGVAPYGPNAFSTLSLVEQAYLEAVLPLGSGLTVDVGKFVTLMGNEVIESNANWNYSRSLLFAYAIPYYHEGIRMTYSFASNFTASLHIVNSWNSVIDNNRSKSIGLGLTYTPTQTTTLVLNGMSGFEQPVGAVYGKKDVGEIILTQEVGDELTFAADANYGQERVGGFLNIWKGVALYGKYIITPKSDLALRGEVYYDPSGYTTGAGFPKATFKEVTLTYEYDMTANLMLRGELRDDFSNGPMFISASTGLPARTSQPTLLIGAVATF
jgi:Putative beta-barrel porin-2, OmpL-like. bbp2